jgi:hypothetical protein
VQPPAPQNPQTVREQRINYLRGLSTIPQYANNPVAMQRVQSEIDRLSSVKPMVEHNFAVGNDMVQPHISYDEGRNWQPIPGSKPSHKFAAQITNDQMPSVTDDTVEMDAWRYLTDGTLPPNMGRGQQGAAQATKIRNRSAELAKEMGMAPDEIRFAQLTNKTGIQALGQLSRARAQILQFEKTANMNSDLALEASEKVDRTGLPVINRWIQAGRTQIAGDPRSVQVSRGDRDVRKRVRKGDVRRLRGGGDNRGSAAACARRCSIRLAGERAVQGGRRPIEARDGEPREGAERPGERRAWTVSALARSRLALKTKLRHRCRRRNQSRT